MIDVGTDGIYRSKRGERRLKSLYETLLADLDADFDRRFVETRSGETHVLAIGAEGAPPVVVFHGGNVVNPVSLSWFLPLADEFRLYAPDRSATPDSALRRGSRPATRATGSGRATSSTASDSIARR